LAVIHSDDRTFVPPVDPDAQLAAAMARLSPEDRAKYA
jgi:hypothetical protein